MTHLFISIAMLIGAPLIYFIVARFERVWVYTNKALILAVTCLVVLHLLPESMRAIGWPATVLAFVGLFLPSLLERLWKRGASRVHAFPVILSLLGLVAHGVMDGAAISTSVLSSERGAPVLSYAVLLHRLPAAVLVWSLFYPRKGPLFPTILLALLGLATTVGYLVGLNLLEAVHDNLLFHGFQALVSGSLLHIAFDQHDSSPHHSH